MKKRPNPEFHKQLKPWNIEPAGRPGWIKITCPYCVGIAYVKRGRWLHGSKRQFIGRSCTYCYKTGRIPVYTKEWKK